MRGKAGCVLWCIVILLLTPMTVCAAEEAAVDGIQEELLEEFSFHEIEEMLKDILPEQKVGFQELLRELLQGNVEDCFSILGDLFADQLFYELRHSKSMIGHILMIGMIAAVFTNFSSVFQNHQVSDISFLVLYFMLITVSLRGFEILLVSVETYLQRLSSFMGVLGPVFFVAVAIASGSLTSVGFYQILLLIIYLVELVVLNFLLPMTQLYLVVSILNGLSKEAYLSKFAELIEWIVSWTQKSLLAGIVGLNAVQGLLSPAMDVIKKSVVTRGAEAIPVIGDALGGTAEVLLGTAVLIKNGIGVAGAIFCLVLCLIPIVQMGVVALMYKLTAAMVQPISDKRIVGCINSLAVGCEMLLKIIFTSSILFLLTITVVASIRTS